MALNRIKHPDDMEICPYDPSHQEIRVRRLPYHLMKCRRNHAGLEYETCPFNARHEFPAPEKRYHIANCPDKAILELQIAHECSREGGTMYKGCTDMPVSDWVPPEPFEDWDAEAAPIARIGIDERLLDIDPNMPRFKDTTGMTPAEKKEFKRRLLLIAERRGKGECIDDIDLDVVKHPIAVTTASRLPKTKPRVIAAKEQLYEARNVAGVGRGIQQIAQKSRNVANFDLDGFGRGGASTQKMKPPSFAMIGINNLTLLSFGRGIGRGISSARREQQPRIIPQQPGVMWAQTGQQPDEQLDSDRGNISDLQQEVSRDDDSMSREIRNINAELHSIAKLEAQVKRGEMLNSEELRKLELRVDYEMRLEELNMKLTES
ncbi:uncharacterized protein LOC141909842 [Tubulanus polymorphus]|uniref:uncharacterized protein LOC141909842 n=1 Tax=Tubulanus polymorphus TaxID=672921 RepID=UPI003DA2D164